MKLQTTLFVLALSAASCGTVSADVSDGSDLTRTEGPCLDCGEGSAAAGATAGGAGVMPAPSGETAASSSVDTVVESRASQFAGLEMFDASAVVVTGSSEVGAGRYVGNLVLDTKRATITGAGAGQTVIDGNLIVGGQCKVSGLTVTGDVIFTGNNARVDVTFFGQVLDYGMHNRH